eukprot:4547034-Pleurochrysis_carterae.AAC.5
MRPRRACRRYARVRGHERAVQQLLRASLFSEHGAFGPDRAARDAQHDAAEPDARGRRRR